MAEQESSAAATNGAHAQDWDPATEGKAKRQRPEDEERHANIPYVSQVLPPGVHPHNVPTVSQVLHPEFQKLANPGPLGLLAFAITTFVVGLFECGAGYGYLPLCLLCLQTYLNLSIVFPVPTRKAMSAPTRHPLEL